MPITSQELTDDLLGLIQRKFYEGESVAFNKDKHRLLNWVVLWPADYLEERGVTLRPERYQELFNDIIMVAIQQGSTGNIKYRPAWLGEAVQSHFKIHWEEIYAEGLTGRRLAEKALQMAGNIPLANAPDPVREMALANRLVKGIGRTKKTPVKQSFKEQPSLL